MTAHRLIPIFGKEIEPSADETFERARRIEHRNAEAASFHARAYLEMPESLRQDAERWGMSAFMSLVWQNAFACGYKQAERDRAATRQEAAGGE